LGDLVNAASACIGLGNTYYTINKYDEAIEFYQRALKVYESVGDLYSIAIMNNNIGGVNYSMGNYDTALKNYQDALDFYVKANDTVNQSLTSGNLAKCFIELDRVEEGITILHKCILIAESIGEKVQLSSHYTALSAAYKKLEQHPEAIKTLKKLAKMNKEWKKLANLVDNYNEIGDTYLEMNKFDKALESYEEAKDLVESCLEDGECYQIDLIEVKRNIAWTYMQAEDYEKAIEFYNEIVDWYEGENSLLDAAFYGYSLAMCYENAGKSKKAIKTYNRCIDWTKENPNSTTAKCYARLGSIYEAMDDNENAYEHLGKASDIFQQIEDQEFYAGCRLDMARLLFNNKQYDAALQAFEHCLQLFVKLEDMHSAGYTYDLMARSYFFMNDFKTAQVYFAKAKENLSKHDKDYDFEDIDMFLSEIHANINDRPDGV